MGQSGKVEAMRQLREARWLADKSKRQDDVPGVGGGSMSLRAVEAEPPTDAAEVPRFQIGFTAITEVATLAEEPSYQGSAAEATSDGSSVNVVAEVSAGKPIGAYSDEELTVVVSRVLATVKAEPELVIESVMEELGFKRKGKIIRRRVLQVLDGLVQPLAS